jgi:molybdate transport system permease protein
MWTALLLAVPVVSAAELRVAAASDLAFVLPEIVAGFEKQSGATVKVSFGSSGNFAAQIQNGAPFDIFMAADIGYPRKLIEAGFAECDSLYVYGVGRIVLWVPNSGKVDVERLQMQTLLDVRIRRIAIANPQHAPYGRAAAAALTHYRVYEQVKPKLVLGENISQAAQFVQSGNADAGIVALSLIFAPAMRDKGRYWLVPTDFYPPLEQGAVILKSAHDPKLARGFVDYLRSAGAAELFRRYGFETPKAAGSTRQIGKAKAMDWQAILLTIKLAALVSAILLLLGLPIAYWLAFTRARWKFLIEAVVAMPLVLPPTVLGFYILVTLGQQSFLGRTIQAWLGATIPFTFTGLVVASVLYSLPFAVQPFAAGFSAVDNKLIQASWLLGASKLRTFSRVILPLAAPAVVTGVVLSFAHTLGEFGVVLMVGGNIPGATRTISISIYDSVQALDYDTAGTNALVLLLFSFVTLSLVYGLSRRSVGVLR